MSKSLSNILNNLSAMPVTNGFIKYRQNQFDLGYAKAEVNIDAQLLEYYLISLGLVGKTDSIKNDFYFNDMYIDVKEVNNKWFNVGGKNGDKKYWWTRNISEGELTHFLFIKSDRNQNELLSDGDTVNIKEHAIWQATEIINQLQKSNYGGYYMDPKLIFKKKE